MRKVLTLLIVFLVLVTLQVETKRIYANNDTLTSIYSLKLTDINDKSFDFQSLKGNIFVLSFGATWCSTCQAELPALEDIKNEYKDKPVKFFWVSIDEKNVSNNELKAFARKLNFSYPILRDPKSEAYLKYTNRYRLPTILFVKDDGSVVAPLIFGMFPTAEEYKTHMRKRLNAMLKAEAKPVKP